VREKGRKEHENMKLGTVAHTCNPSYAGRTHQEDCSLRPAGGGEGEC
jgi:hypothetical protein